MHSNPHCKSNLKFPPDQKFAKKKLFIGSRSWVKPRPKPETKINFGLDPEFDSIHVGIKINKCLKFLTFGSRNVRKI
jgi:hypothetical protein